MTKTWPTMRDACEHLTLCTHATPRLQVLSSQLTVLPICDLAHQVWHCCALQMTNERTADQVRVLALPVLYALESHVRRSIDQEPSATDGVCQAAYLQMTVSLGELGISADPHRHSKAEIPRLLMSLATVLSGTKYSAPGELRYAVEESLAQFQQPVRQPEWMVYGQLAAQMAKIVGAHGGRSVAEPSPEVEGDADELSPQEVTDILRFSLAAIQPSGEK